MNNIIDIQIPKLQEKLNSLNKSSAEKKQTKASLFNLIIYANEARRTLYFEELINTILSKFPCRIIFIQAYETDHEHFDVTISNVMSGIGKGQVSCDQITIKSSKNQLCRVPSILFPCILSDLPMYLLWGQSPFEEHLIFPCLQPYASRVIIDAECFNQLPIFCRQMETHLNLLKMDIMDMNWALLSSWREMLTHIFDRPEKIELLKKSKSIIISYNSKKTETVNYPEIRSIYFQGWLACCLGASYRQVDFFEDNMIISYFGKHNPLVIALEQRLDLKTPPGTILDVAITFSSGDSYTITPKPALSQAIIHETSLEMCALPYTLPLHNVYSGMAFLNEILYQKAGEHYRMMLHMISQLNFERQNGRVS